MLNNCKQKLVNGLIAEEEISSSTSKGPAAFQYRNEGMSFTDMKSAYGTKLGEILNTVEQTE